jgi:uncharacterized membrane protein YeaQ/YmgE (transglycosylase-associated protein family)
MIPASALYPVAAIILVVGAVIGIVCGFCASQIVRRRYSTLTFAGDAIVAITGQLAYSLVWYQYKARPVSGGTSLWDVYLAGAVLVLLHHTLWHLLRHR